MRLQIRGNYYGERLPLERCPHCQIANPLLEEAWSVRHLHFSFWGVYRCSSCQKYVLATASGSRESINLFRVSDGALQVFPSSRYNLDDSIPDTAKRFLRQALNNVSNPDACLVMCGGAIDAMLQAKGIEADTLNLAIKDAVEKQIITKDMSDWAHRVRLESNDSRHPSGDASEVPTPDEAQQCFDFTLALADILFVLPARHQKSIGQGQSSDSEQTPPEDA